MPEGVVAVGRSWVPEKKAGHHRAAIEAAVTSMREFAAFLKYRNKGVNLYFQGLDRMHT